MINPNQSPISNHIKEIYNKVITIQVKYTSNTIIGYTKISLNALKDNNTLQVWLPISKERDPQILFQNDIFKGTDERPRLLLNIQLSDEQPVKSPMYRSPDRNPFRHNNLESQNKQHSQSPIEQKDDYSNGTYEEISENITLIQARPENLPQRQTVQSHNQQFFKVKKRNFTQQSQPTISLNGQAPKESKQEQKLNLSQQIKDIVSQDLLTQLDPQVDKAQIKTEIIQFVDQKLIKQLQDDQQQKMSEINQFIAKTKQIGQNDKQDVIQNDQRQLMLQQLSKNTSSLVTLTKEQEAQKQQVETQIKLLDIHGQHHTKKEKLQRLQEAVQKLKQELQLLQRQQSSNDVQSGQDQTQKIHQLKQELLSHLQQIKQEIQLKSLQDKVNEEVDQLKDNLLRIQNDQTVDIERLASEKLQHSLEYQNQEDKFNSLKGQGNQLQFAIDKQGIEINSLSKQIQNENQQIQNIEQQYKELIKKQMQKIADEQQKHQQMIAKVEDLKTENSSIQESLQNAKQKLNSEIFERINDGKLLLSSQAVQIQQQAIEEAIRQLSNSIEEKLAVINNLKTLNLELSTRVSPESLEQMIAQSLQVQDKIRDKNDILDNKEFKNLEIVGSIDQSQAQNETLQHKIDINKQLLESKQVLDVKQRELDNEIIKLRKINFDYAKWLEESKEKLDIQREDFQTFDKDMRIQQEELKEQRLIEEQKLSALLKIRTKNELENSLRDKVAQIREMEALLRGKDHEIDTLEMIQSQKDSIILELEENAGKFKEVVKEVHYESQKNDKVETALYRYQEQHPMKIAIKKLGDGYYKFGSKRIYLKLDTDEQTLLVRVGPKEYITLSMFIIENEGVETHKMGLGNAIATRFKKHN